MQISMKTKTAKQKYLLPEAECIELTACLQILASSPTEGDLESFDSLTDYEWN